MNNPYLTLIRTAWRYGKTLTSLYCVLLSCLYYCSRIYEFKPPGISFTSKVSRKILLIQALPSTKPINNLYLYYLV